MHLLQQPTSGAAAGHHAPAARRTQALMVPSMLQQQQRRSVSVAAAAAACTVASPCLAVHAAAAARHHAAPAAGPLQQGAASAPGAAQRRRQRGVACRSSTWKVFGPSQDWSDGDADYFQTTSRLAQQYPWFAPGGEEPAQQQQGEDEMEQQQQQGGSQLVDPMRRPKYGLSQKQIASLGLSGPQAGMPDPATLSSRAYLRGDKFRPEQLGFSATVGMGAGAPPSNASGAAWSATMAGRRSGGGARAAYGDYQSYPEGRPLFLPEAERFGNPPDLPSLLLQQRIIYISMPFVPSVTELVVAQCYYLDFDERNRQKPIYVYLNSTGCINEKNQALSADNEFYAIWAALGFVKAPLYTGVTWKAQNQAAVLLSAGQKGHRYTFPHAKISTAPPIVNRVFGQVVDAQLQASELEYATKYYAALLARSTGKDLATCQKQYLSRRRYFSVKEAYEEGLVDKLIPGFKLNRFRKMAKDRAGDGETFFDPSKPKFRFTRQAQ